MNKKSMTFFKKMQKKFSLVKTLQKNINKSMDPREIRKFIEIVDAQEPYENIWNSHRVFDRINDLLDPLKFVGPDHDQWHDMHRMVWSKIVKENPLVKICFALCKRDYNIDIWVYVSVEDDNVRIFEYFDDPPATVSAVLFAVEKAVKIAHERMLLSQRLVEPIAN